MCGCQCLKDKTGYQAQLGSIHMGLHCTQRENDPQLLQLKYVFVVLNAIGLISVIFIAECHDLSHDPQLTQKDGMMAA